MNRTSRFCLITSVVGVVVLLCYAFGNSRHASFSMQLFERINGTLRYDVEKVNTLVRKRFGNVKFRDQKLAVLNYTIVPIENICKRVQYVVIVHVRPNDLDARNQWRRTYGRLQKEFGYAVIFAVGQAKTLSGNDAVNYEASIYGDILQSDFIDAYRNLTLKSIAAFRYVAVTCPNARAVVKLNDVIGWNIENSKPIIANAIEDGKIHCSRIAPNGTHMRNRKWFTINRLSKNMYNLTQCLGIAYVLPRRAMLRILDVVSKEQFFWVDNIFVTGQLAERAGVGHSDIGGNVSTQANFQWNSNAAFTLTSRNRIEQFFVISNAKWFFRNCWLNKNCARFPKNSE